MQYIILWIRLAFGAHSLLSGLNYFFEFLPPPRVVHPLAGPFVDSMTEMGLFGVIKVVESLVGICLITNKFVPLALVAELPTSITIFWMSVIVIHSERSVFTGSRELAYNLFLIAMYAGYYVNLLKQTAKPVPVWNVWRDMLAKASNKDGAL